jgi:hypothetical protein
MSYSGLAESFAFVLDKYKVTSQASSTANSQSLANEIAKSIANSAAKNDANIITQTIDILNNEYNLEKKQHEPFIFNQAAKGLYYNWSSSASPTYVCYTYSPATTFIINKIADPNAKLQQSEVLIFAKTDINDKTQSKPLYKLVLPSYVQGVRSSLIIEDDPLDPFVLLGTFSYPETTNPNKCFVLKWYFMDNTLEVILNIYNANVTQSIIRNISGGNDNIYLSTQNDADAQIIPKIYKLATKDVIKYNTLELQQFLSTYTLTCKNEPIYGTIWDIEIDADQNIFISIPLQSVDPTKLSGFNIRGRLYYNKLGMFDEPGNVNVLPLIGNNYYPPGFNEDALSGFQTQCNGTNNVTIYSISDFSYQLLAISPDVNSLIASLGSLNSLNDIEQFILQIRELLKNVDINGFKVLYFNKNDLYTDKYPPIYCLIGEPPLNTINKSTAGNGRNNMYNVHAWQSTVDVDNNKVYISSLDISASMYDFFIGLIKPTYPIIYSILYNLPENIKILILDILINQPTLPILFDDKKFYFDVIEIDTNHQIRTITTDGFEYAKPKLPDEGVITMSIVKNDKGKFLSVGSTCFQSTNSAKIYTLKL